MVAGNRVTIRCGARYFSYRDACRMAQEAEQATGPGPICLCLENASDTSTAALARLVSLRRKLLRAGRDICIRGLRGRADARYQVCRMSALLPRKAASAATA